MSIKLKILLALVLTSCFGLVISFYFLYQEQIQQNEIEMISMTSNKGESTALKVERRFVELAAKLKEEYSFVKSDNSINALPDKISQISNSIQATWIYEDVNLNSKIITNSNNHPEIIEELTPILNEKYLQNGLELFYQQRLLLIEFKNEFYGIYINKIQYGKRNIYPIVLVGLADILSELANDGLFRNILLKKNGDVIYNSVAMEGIDYQLLLSEKIIPGIKNIKRGSTKKIKVNNVNLTYNLSKINNPELYLLTLTDTKKFNQPLLLFFVKSVLILITTVCFAIIIAIFMSNKISGPILVLTEATKNIAEENFQIDLEIKSKDEIGSLATSFKEMSNKISELLQDLRLYNEQLEEMVEKRTEELKQALELNKTMLNSVSQGFMMFDSNFKILPTYSKATESILEMQLKDITYLDVVKDVDKDGNLAEFLGLVFDEYFPFEDVVSEIPSVLKVNNKHIELEYFPVRDSDGKILFLVAIATDKTKEQEYKREFESSYAFAQLVSKATEDRTRFVNFLTKTKKETSRILKEFEKYSIDEIFRFVHTLKGNSGLYSMRDLHLFCSELEENIKVQEETSTEIIDDLKQLNDILQEEIQKISKIVYISPENLESSVVLSPGRLDKRKTFLLDQNKLLEKKELDLLTDYSLINEEMNSIEKMIFEISQKVKKPAPNVIVTGPELYLKNDFWMTISEQLVHLIRNSLDHGIEYPEKRIEDGKNAEGNLKLGWGETAGEFFFILQDDGAGINAEALKKKLISTETLTEEEFDINKVGEYLFLDRVSTKEEVTDISGQGVGLASVKQIIEELGGRIEVSYENGKGTAFTSIFPINNEMIFRDKGV